MTQDSRRQSGSLHQLHATASRSEGLTTFDDLTSPPPASITNDVKSFDMVQSGLSGLYSRLKASVGGNKEQGNEHLEEVMGVGAKNKAVKRPTLPKSPAGTAVSSPVVVSVPSSRLQSPLAPTFPEPPLPPSRDSNISSSAISAKPSWNGSKSSLGTTRSRPSITSTVDTGKTAREDESFSHSPLSTMSKPHGHPLEAASKNSSSSGLLSGSKSRDALRYRSERTNYRQRNDMDLVEQESDTTEDDVVLVEGETKSRDKSGSAFPLDVVGDDLARVTSRTERQYKLPSKPVKEPSSNDSQTTEMPHVTANAQTPVLAPAPQRPPLVQVGPSHLPGFHPSRMSSSDGLSSVITTTTVRSPAVPPIEEVQRPTMRPSSTLSHVTPSQVPRKLLSREYWMRDENAKDCFNCGDAFSTFRRKHHCRTCGQIFDSKCTVIVSGKMFGQTMNVRVCKPCEDIIQGNGDDSSEYTDEGDQASLYEHDEDNSVDGDQFDPSESDHTKIGTPTISIPMSRKVGSEKKRRSAVIEVAPQLPRPSSSRSLRSLSGRPRSSSHKRHHQHMRNVRHDERAPFHQYHTDLPRSRSALPAFHHDNIIDPDLAPFMSDEGSSDDEPASIFATLRADSPTHPSMDHEKGGLGGLLAAMRKGKGRADRSTVGGAYARDTDTASITSRHISRHSKRRNLSVSSITHRPSPRRSKSNSLLKPFGAGFSGTSPSPQPAILQPSPAPPSTSKITRSASMQGGNAPQIELNQASLEHVRRLLKQMLQDAGISHASSWERALVPILLQCTDDVNPDLHRGDDIDIRHYIKLKKIPGGRPRDTSYVSGVIFSKNVALKSMPRNVAHPKILIITFAVEYARHQTHFMSLDPVIAQEREYLKNIVDRIVALRPNVLLIQRNVSGLALEFLEEAGISVAYNVKETVLNAVARCTQSRPVSSVDQLADQSRLGRCGSFDVKTYVHKGAKRNYIFLSGCQPDLGCTIALRGDGAKSLAKLKRITEFMCYVVYNLKLETCLMRDEFVLIPVTSNSGTIATNNESLPSHNADDADTSTEKPSITGDNSQTTALALQVPLDAPAPSFYSEMVENHRTKLLSASPFVKFMQPYLLNQAREYEKKLGYLKQLRDQYTATDTDAEGTPQKFNLVQPEMVHGVVDQASKQVREFLHAVHASEYEKALHNYKTQKRQWEAYLATNAELFDPFNHQKIAVLYSVVNTAYSTPCIGPDIIALNFYQEHDFDDGFTPDCTLGQYVEDLCHGVNSLCEVDGCNRRMVDHSRQYVHGEGQMSAIVQKYPSKIKGLQNTILMWSCCRICGQETQVIPMSDSTWKYSFAKYLELTFWSSQLHPRAGICPHDIHKDHVRYFGFNNAALRVQYDPVSLYEVTVPRPIVTWKVDSDLRLKNDQFLKIEERLDRFMVSVRARIKGIHVESVIPEKVELCRIEVDRLMKRANDEHDWLKAKLQDKYLNSKYYEIIPMNRAIRAIQEKAIAWDETFVEFEQQYFPSEKDIRRLATLQLKKLFLERDESTSSLTSVEEGSEISEERSINEKGEPLALPPMPSSMSPERARVMLNSVVEEDHSQSNAPPEVEANNGSEAPLAPEESKPNQLLPVQTPYDALERDDVRHLDLAVSSRLQDHPITTDEELLKTPTMSPEQDFNGPGSPTPTALPRVDPIDKMVADVIENMPASPTPSYPAGGPLESKIPRLVDTIRRETSSHARPATLIRTQSQPGGIPKSPSPPQVVAASRPLEPTKKSGSDAARAMDRITDRLSLGTFKQSKTSSKIPRSIPIFRSQREASKVSKLAEHFEQLSREFQRERMRERRNERGRQARAYPLASSKPIVEVYKDVHEAVQEHNPSDEEILSSPARISTDNSTLEDSALTGVTGATTASESPVEERYPKESHAHLGTESQPTTPSHPPSDFENELSDVEIAPEDVPLPDSDLLSMTESQLENSLELPKHEKTTLMKMLTSFWSERSASGWTPLDYPFAQIEHVWEDSDIIVREDEPSSIIALALSAPHYLTQLQSFRGDIVASEKGDSDSENLEASIERNLLHEANSNIRYGFNNRGVKAQCKIFYAQSFDALRRKCGVADRFVESLSRCSKWDSKGGKSKSIFLKTLDDRFVLKSLSPIEVQAFFRFAPNYFAFTHQNLFKGLPSVIAKMFGLFQVQIKTPTGRDFDWYMLVMENLFYDREPNRRYDLKGSMRNRKIESTGERDEVLLDENLVDIIYSETPIFVREHTKKLLKASVWNDTLFLSQNNVMDYSLMAGFDDANHEIIVGIIDCIRTYTWDKKLESWIKDRGKNKPTITSPRDYRNRFRSAMDKYILQAPNCWHQFSGRVVGGALIGSRKTIMLEPGPGSASTQIMEVEGGDMEKAEAATNI
ncbi:Mitochondrial distribution and morphology protein 12 [Paraconiothyrium brasiliense]|uniref:1-phosphatidylinositol-3-phosphate 5-kinase n=1 Tax=Paraconiothyrium brasiliense TaxID=300254 RepID=A0ABR3S8G8_9PLEO